MQNAKCRVHQKSDPGGNKWRNLFLVQWVRSSFLETWPNLSAANLPSFEDESESDDKQEGNNDESTEPKHQLQKSPM